MLYAVLSFNLMETDDPQTPRDPERVIGREMRRIRERLGLTQQEVAERMHTSGLRFHQTQIAKMERGERPIRVNEWIAVATALGTTPQDMLSSAIAAGVSEPLEEQASLADLEREREAVEKRLRDAEEQLAAARAHMSEAAMARERAEMAARDSEMRLVAAQAHANELTAVRDHLERRLWDARAAERRAKENAELDSVLEDAEHALEALDGLVPLPIGKRLAAARRQKNLSVEAVADAASLDPGVVRTLEEPDYFKILTAGLKADTERGRQAFLARCEGMKLAIRSFAVALDIDPEPLIEQFADEMRGKEKQ